MGFGATGGWPSHEETAGLGNTVQDTEGHGQDKQTPLLSLTNLNVSNQKSLTLHCPNPGRESSKKSSQRLEEQMDGLPIPTP